MIFWIFVILEALPVRKRIPILSQHAASNQLLAVLCFWCFFECACFWFFVILSALRLHFGFHFDSLWGALGLWKNSWKCVTVINFRGLTPCRQSLFAGLDCGCVLMVLFSRFLWLGAVLRVPVWDLLVPFVATKWVLKNRCKKSSKMGLRATQVKPSPGLWAP